jgi:hypothetical protein
MTVFWDAGQISLLETDGRFRYAYFLYPIMDAVSNVYETTGRNITEHSRFHTCRRENLKSHLVPTGT